jgi:oligopeptidase B
MAVSEPTPPVAKRVPKVDVVHGEKREDAYFWLRQKDHPDVLAYLRAENAYTDHVMAGTDGFQEALYQELLGRIKEDDQSVPYRRGDWLYYARTEKGKQYAIHCRKKTPEGPEEVTLDLNLLAEGYPFIDMGAYAVSDDGRWLAYTTDVTGFREYTLYVKDLVSGALLADRVEKVSSVAWAAGDDTLFYVTEDHAKRAHRLWRHRLGATADDLLYEETDELFRLYAWRSRSRAFLFLGSHSFTSTEMRFLPAAQPDAAWQLLQPRENDHEYHVDHAGDRFYIRTNGDGARNFRLVTAPIDAPGKSQWTEILAHREDVMLEDLDVFNDFFVVHEREDGLVRLRVTDRRDGTWHHIAFPEPAYDVGDEPNVEPHAGAYRFRYQSMVTPATVYDYDVGARQLHMLKQHEVLGGYDPARYRAERVHATAPDGRRIPISLVRPLDAPRDGTGAMVLAGYGAYGFPYPVMFSSHRLSLLERGVGFAVAHIRGGGDLGKRWHDAGRMMAKRNTFTDFIAAADFLVAEGYVARDRLVIEGGSAGGLLIGAVLNLRPDLCGAAVLRVPFVDVINTMLDESLPLTVGEFEEWGNPKIREQYQYMKSYCPYTNLGAHAYPSMLVRTSLNDSQVMYWEPAKYVAKLRTLKTGPNPLLFKIDLDAGHGGPSGRYDLLREIAFDYAFVLSATRSARGAWLSDALADARPAASP